ncbi:uncharacterized protein DEA37_0001825 [Paragonimus westermani]|uniref:Integrase zinc-binding domain-containing protein n=1 Tax=Paragonimus westermani TaxID=34504 RepID=A0A5J4P0M1_9TREM|nr:uncharacterized protein DEA37_0001825 [Paragonimus westermani]
MQPNDATTAQLYGLPKIHKDDIPPRPIVSLPGTLTYNLAKDLFKRLRYLIDGSEHSISDAVQFLNKLKHVMHRFVGFEVEPMSISETHLLTKDGSVCERPVDPVPLSNWKAIDENTKMLQFSYEVIWESSPIRWASRLDIILKSQGGQPERRTVPDLLSRTQHLGEVHKDVTGVNSIELESGPGKLQAAQERDKAIRVMIDRLLSGEQSPEDEVNPELKAFRMHWSDLRLNSAGILMRQLRDGINVPVIPAELREAIVKECHQLAHTGCHRTYEMLKQRAY